MTKKVIEELLRMSKAQNSK